MASASCCLFWGKTILKRRILINTIGPVWDGNEVWMITAGGAMFAAFPHVYATLFSGFYLALFLLLLALIGRGVGFEFRSKRDHPGWRAGWDRVIFVGSLVPALLWGVAVTNLIAVYLLMRRCSMLAHSLIFCTPILCWADLLSCLSLPIMERCSLLLRPPAVLLTALALSD